MWWWGSASISWASSCSPFTLSTPCSRQISQQLCIPCWDECVAAKFLRKFVRAISIQTSQSLTSVPFEDNQNQLQENIIANCSAAFALKWFIVSLQKFYISVTTKMLAKDPIRDSVVCGLSLLNPRIRGDLPPSFITDIARRFPNFVAEEDFTNLEEVFLDYWITPVSEFHSCNNVRTDELWGSILHLSNRIPKSKGFPLWIKWYLL